MKTKVECINCKKTRSKNIAMFQMHVLTNDSEYTNEGEWEEVDRVPVCFACLKDPVTAATVIGYLTGAD